MMGWLFSIPLWLVCWLEGAPPKICLGFCLVWMIAYYVIRILANVIKDHDREVELVWNRRKHFSRPSFRMWNDKDGLHVEGGPDPDHATRCQNSLRDWYDIERRLKWNNWIYAAWIFGLAFVLNRL